jgi:hypothetical protein
VWSGSGENLAAAHAPERDSRSDQPRIDPAHRPLTGPARALGRRVDEPNSVAGLLFERIAQARVMWQFRIDAAAIVILYTAAFLVYGAHGWMLLAALAGRAFIIALSLRHRPGRAAGGTEPAPAPAPWSRPP